MDLEIDPRATDPEIDPQAVAAEFLALWDRAHQAGRPSGEVYGALGEKFALFTGPVTCGEADAVHDALHTGRVARGWPDPDPERMQVTVEAVIMFLWLGGLRSVGHREHGDDR